MKPELEAAGAVLIGGALYTVAQSNTRELRKRLDAWLATPDGAAWAAEQAERQRRIERERPAQVERLWQWVDLRLFEPGEAA